MFSMLMTVFGRETGVPASTAGGGVDVAVGNICVGNGVIVGAGDGGGAAQAVNKSKSERKIDRWLFIFSILSQADEMYKLTRAGVCIFTCLSESRH